MNMNLASLHLNIIKNLKTDNFNIYYNIKMKLRNATFNKCKFNNVTFNRLPAISFTEKEEGCQIAYGGVKMPIMKQDPYNAYNHICVGWTKPIGDKIYIYDKDTHALYKKYFNNEVFNVCDVYKNFWNGYEINHVDFVDSDIENTIINDIKFLNGSLDGVIVKNVIFDNIEFDNYIITNTIFDNCQFDDGYFWECRIGKSNRYKNVTGKKMVFQTTKMDRQMLNLFDKKEIKLSLCQDYNGRVIHE